MGQPIRGFESLTIRHKNQMPEWAFYFCRDWHQVGHSNTVAGFGTSAQSARSERGPRAKRVGIYNPSPSARKINQPIGVFIFYVAVVVWPSLDKATWLRELRLLTQLKREYGTEINSAGDYQSRLTIMQKWFGIIGKAESNCKNP